MAVELKGRVVIVTGASKGIGRAAAEAFASEGSHVVLTGRTSGDGPGSVDRAVNEIVTAGGSAIGLVSDVASESDVAELVATTLRTFGRIDVLVNNAGVLDSYIKSWEIETALFDENIAIHLKGTFLCSKSVIPILRAQGGGSIVNLTSSQSLADAPPASHLGYAVSKAGVNRITTFMAQELLKFDIAVNAIHPQGIKTEGAVAHRDESFDFSGYASPSALCPGILFLARQRGDFTGKIVWRDEIVGGEYHSKERQGVGPLPNSIEGLSSLFE
jgi:NAD(P)-dependent dehydrogenase (short-subunit alcohol dehydrogenase family)